MPKIIPYALGAAMIAYLGYVQVAYLRLGIDWFEKLILGFMLCVSSASFWIYVANMVFHIPVGFASTLFFLFFSTGLNVGVASGINRYS